MRQRFWVWPMAALRDTPVTYILTFAVAGMSVWLGEVLLTTTVNLPPERLVGYHGPIALFDLHIWGWWFVVGGVLGFMRPLAHRSRQLSLGMHLAMMLALVAWALAFDFGSSQATTGQPAYTFLAVVCFLTPWLPTMIERRYGKRPNSSGF